MLLVNSVHEKAFLVHMDGVDNKFSSFLEYQLIRDVLYEGSAV